MSIEIKVRTAVVFQQEGDFDVTGSGACLTVFDDDEDLLFAYHLKPGEYAKVTYTENTSGDNGEAYSDVKVQIDE